MANVYPNKETTPPRGPLQTRPKGGFSPAGLGEYFRGVREELQKAKWPTRAELIKLTQVVLAVIAIVALYVYTIDVVLSWVTRQVLGFGK